MRVVLCALVATTILVGSGCETTGTRLNAPPHGTAENVHPMQSMYTHMADNALLADMTISDVHFVPHRAMLNSLGEQRLSRLASLMEMYGGVIRFDTTVEDPELVDQRMATVVDYLCETGLDTSAELVRQDLPGGRGLDATEVILIKLMEGTYQPGDSADSSQATGD